MKIGRLIFYIALIALPAWVSCTPASAREFIKTNFLSGDIHTYPPEYLERSIKRLQQTGFNSVTLPVAWSVVEPEPGQFDLSPYYPALDRITASGLKLMIHLDASAREVLIFDGQDLYSSGTTGVPHWLIKQFPDASAMDSSGARAHNLDYADRQHLPDLERFYRATLAALQSRYGDRVTAVIPGLVHELELKYAQWGYRWQSYTAAAQLGFADWLSSAGQSPAPLPVVDYGNRLENYTPRVEPLFAEFMRYREQSLRDYVCHLTALIREYGYPAASYFGQTLSSHDAIYALGVIEEVVECLDEITVDYNYHDGWQLELNPYVLPVLVNYARNLGYSRVLAGLYLEWFYRSEQPFDTYLPAAQDTLQLLNKEQTAGIEIGNVLFTELALLEQLQLKEYPQAVERSDAAGHRIGIVASKWTYYLWHGERSFGRNPIQDALLASYRLLHQQPDINVSVLGEAALLKQDLSSYDALLLPLQTTLSEAAAKAIRTYYEQGGKLIQDVQYRAFETDGSPRSGWENDLFGIAGISWHQQPDKFYVAGRRASLPAQQRLYFNYTLLAPMPGYDLLMRRTNNLNQGLMLRGPRSLTFGFLPQLIDDPPKEVFWRQVFIDAIRHLLES